jgi:glyoxylase-like metal-dependent hydrolase (beta-lactamase superfamily II)
MTQTNEVIRFPYPDPPAPGNIIEVADGVYWARMNLPMLIDHVNVYILEGPRDLTIIDTGLNFTECKSAWLKIIENNFGTKPVKNVLLTHHHPDHIGLLGWFHDNFEITVYASRTSWLLARMLYLDKQSKPSKQAMDFWIQAGMDKNIFDKKCKAKPFNFSDGVANFPLGFNSLNQGEEICLSGKKWRIEIGQGHAPDHVTLWGLDVPIVISGDQIIPGISSNLGVYPTEPLLDTVGAWLSSCNRFLKLAETDHFVLPGHKLPFLGLSTRLRQLIDNHVSALDRIEKRLSGSHCTAVDLFKPIFKRNINQSEYGLALAEAVGHLNYFRVRNMVNKSIRNDGALLFKLK